MDEYHFETAQRDTMLCYTIPSKEIKKQQTSPSPDPSNKFNKQLLPVIMRHYTVNLLLIRHLLSYYHITNLLDNLIKLINYMLQSKLKLKISVTNFL